MSLRPFSFLFMDIGSYAWLGSCAREVPREMVAEVCLHYICMASMVVPWGVVTRAMSQQSEGSIEEGIASHVRKMVFQI